MSQPPRDPQREAEIAYAREKARYSLPVPLFALVGITAMYLPLPQRFVALLPLVIAVVLAVRLLRFLTPRPGREKVWAGVALGVLTLPITSLLLQALMYGPVSRYEDCIAGAQTNVARGQCERLREASPLGFISD